jgi:hypothetical protein
VIEQQLSAAISATAGVIVGAWEQAGRPKMYIAQPRPPQRSCASSTVRIHLIPLGRSRFEPYAEPPVDDQRPLSHDAGRIRRWLHRANQQWHGLVDGARLRGATTGFAKWRDSIVCKLADSLDEQRDAVVAAERHSCDRALSVEPRTRVGPEPA